MDQHLTRQPAIALRPHHLPSSYAVELISSPILLMLFSGTALALALFLILTVADIKGVAAGVAATVIITAVTT